MDSESASLILERAGINHAQLVNALKTRIERRVTEIHNQNQPVPPALQTVLTLLQQYPQPGDEWEFKLPGKPKRRKIIDRVDDVHGKRVDDTEGLFDYVHWQRLPKGRYSGLSVLLLKRHGRRISTKAERDAHLQQQIAKAKANRSAKALQQQKSNN